MTPEDIAKLITEDPDVNQRARQWRGETAPHNLEDLKTSASHLINEVKSGTYHGRYYNWNDPDGAIGYVYGNGVIIECDIDPNHLIAESGLMALMDDFIDQLLDDDIETQRSHGVPESLIKGYVDFYHKKKNGLIGERIRTADGSIPKEAIPLLIEISQYLFEDGCQVILIDRPLKASELKGCYIVKDRKAERYDS